ncbi:MAG: hypothetical protein ACRELY_31610 [Polyangiaceae bacterium]
MSRAEGSRSVQAAGRLPRDAHDQGARIAESHGMARSPRWPAVERAHLAKHPVCAACLRGGAKVDVHHILPFHICIALGRPDLELDERNLITLCAQSDARGAGNHHLLLGHLDDWSSMNLDVAAQAARRFHGLDQEKLRACKAWRSLVARRPFGVKADEIQVRRALNRRFP